MIGYIVAIFVLLFLSLVARFAFNIKSNLYLISNDSTLDHQMIIPITAIKNKSLFNRRSENLSVRLADLTGTSHDFQISFSPISGHKIRPTSNVEDNEITLKNRSLRKDITSSLKHGAVLSLNGREYKVVITTKRLGQTEIFGLRPKV